MRKGLDEIITSKCMVGFKGSALPLLLPVGHGQPVHPGQNHCLGKQGGVWVCAKPLMGAKSKSLEPQTHQAHSGVPNLRQNLEHLQTWADRNTHDFYVVTDTGVKCCLSSVNVSDSHTGGAVPATLSLVEAVSACPLFCRCTLTFSHNPSRSPFIPTLLHAHCHPH